MAVDLRRRYQEFRVGDDVMIRIRPERFPSGAVRKLHARSMRPYKILKRVGSNAYVVDIPSDFGINPVFNVEDLVAYRGPTTIPADPFNEPDTDLTSNFETISPTPVLPPVPFSPQITDTMEQILDDQIVSTQNGGYQRYLVRWHGRPPSDDTWISRNELQRLASDLLEHYQTSVSPEANFSQLRGVGGDTDHRFQHVYRRRRRT
ncbi:uncharacterized protein LOC120104756 [Phoenix dactylifera]|uniref:Uncharacterized protein LOC120104756 n=1 Tax=Phoenix dactylifera TaxID=42345 RepID=A0A8B8ZEG8_PHODC|nr:uncharacterized protein LOC120104756 [Phoenix dactylifera]